MQTDSVDEVPCLVDAGQGASGFKTVQYKKRFLYSKYNPTRAVTSLVEKLDVLPNTLFLICSPGLWYGLDELLQKTKDFQDIFFVAVEGAPALHGFSKESDDRVPLFGRDQIQLLSEKMNSAVAAGKIKRVVRIDFSAGVQFAQDFYSEIHSGIQNIISTFWKNRITLSKFGRLYSKNILKNLRNSSGGVFFYERTGSVSKKILVCGAGESLDLTGIEELDRSETYIIAVDAALPCLSERGIYPDAVVAVESQFVIQKAYIGSTCLHFTLFMDLCSRPEIGDICWNSEKIYFYTDYTDSVFSRKVRDMAGEKSTFIPMGSVGLYAVEIALRLRTNETVPVFVTGLDFSFSAGRTHAKSAPAFTRQICENTRISGIYNMASCFSPMSFPVKDKNGNTFYTSKIMASYRDLFENLFAGRKNLFDIGKCGLPLGIETAPDANAECPNKSPSHIEKCTGEKDVVAEYLAEEKKKLETVKDLLVNGENSVFRRDGMFLDEQIRDLLSESDYLYNHFPDGHRLQMEAHFLKRVRAEIDFFLKQLG